MVLDTRIPLMAQGIQLESPVNALMQIQQLKNAQQQNALADFQMRSARQAAEQALMDRQRQDQQRQRFESYIGSLNPNAGPARPFDPLQALAATGSPDMVAQLQSVMPKPQARKLTSVAPGASLVDEATGQAVFSAPAKPNEPPEVVQLMNYRDSLPTNSPQRAVLDALLKKQTTHAPGTSVSINTGQKGLDNTLKLRGDFRQEPVYKAHQEMQSAYSQIKQSLAQASPAGDLAGATKMMKLLDPGSVVRESELGMAMAASGLLDRVENYASNIIKGTKLTPTQRADFQRLADALFAESVGQYNAKREEYKGIAERNQLPVADVLGAPDKAPTPQGQWSIKPKGQ